MPRTISLRTIDTHHVFATTNSLPISEQWDWIRNSICESYDWFTRDELDLIETDDGEVVTHRGEPIVRIHDCRMINEARPLVQLDRVA